MSARRRSRRRKAGIVVPVTSMGDIAFLLIIFFVLCSSFVKKAGKNVEPPTAPDLNELPKPRMYVAIDSDRRIYFQGRLVESPGEIEAELIRIIDPNASVEARTVVFECDKSITKDVFEPILESIAEGGGIIGAVGKRAAETRR